MAQTTVASSDRMRWVFLLNTIVIVLASLPLLLIYPAVFARLGIDSLENGFFVRLAGGWLFVEAIASYLAWRGSRPNPDLVYVVIAMKVVFILLVAIATVSGTLPSTGLYPAAVFDSVMSIVFGWYLSRLAAGSR